VYDFVCQGWSQLHAIPSPSFPLEKAQLLSLVLMQGFPHVRIEDISTGRRRLHQFAAACLGEFGW
jgi:hypothetical protein